MTSQSGGGGGYPGVTTDGSNGLIILGEVSAGRITDTPFPAFNTLNGLTQLHDSNGNALDQDPVFTVIQDRAVPLGLPTPYAASVVRQGDITAEDYAQPTAMVRDFTASAQPVLHVEKQGTAVLELTTRKSIVGALSAVADPAAQAVLTSIIAALTDIKVATDNTT